jgi:cation transporter-like permease
MSLVTLIIVLIVLGVVAYLISSYLPMEPRIKTILIWVIIIVALVIVLNAFGVCSALKGTAVPKLG